MASAKLKNALYAQSGGPSAVINATACGVIETARKAKTRIGKLYAARNGIVGALTEDLIDTGRESAAAIRALRHTPGAAFGSCRYKLKGIEQDRAKYERLVEVLRAHDVGWFFYNGGNDSADTAWKLSQISAQMGYPLAAIGVPKTIDNDLVLTDTCPGFGSAAKYVATSIREAAFDVAGMASTSTRVFILEVMGRHAGWLTAACGLASDKPGEPPHILLFPERPFDEAAFLAKVSDTVARAGYCVIGASEGIKDAGGRFLAESGAKDAFGHSQLGGVAPLLAALVKDKLGLKQHWAVADYLQRSARHLVSKTDLEQAYRVGQEAVRLALKGRTAVMPVIVRETSRPYRWSVAEARLEDIANRERKMPADFITEDGFHITPAARRYLQPLIAGEAPPPFKNGLPDYVRLKKVPVKRRVKSAFEI